MDLYSPMDREADARRALLIKLTGDALTGLAARDHERHGRQVPSDDEIGRRAVALARGAIAALEELEADQLPDHEAHPLGPGRTAGRKRGG